MLRLVARLLNIGRFTQLIQKQSPQQVLVKLPERETVMHARTPLVPPPRIDGQRLEEWKCYLVKQCGQPRAQIEAEIAERTQRFGVPIIQAQPPARKSVDEDVIWQ